MRFCRSIVVGLFSGFCLLAAANAALAKPIVELTRDQVEEIVLRSYQYVAMYNVNNKFTFDPANPMATGGVNRVKANTHLADHTLKAIPRPNNDTLYIISLLAMRTEPIILEAPAFDSKCVTSAHLALRVRDRWSYRTD